MRRYFARCATVALIVLCASCSEPTPVLAPLSPDATILAFGDSLTYGTGTSREDSYPSVLAKITHLKVINAGKSGETTQGGLERLPKALQEYHPSLVILSLGGNDIIKRVPVETVKSNLEKMITIIKNTGAGVVLVAAPAPSLTLSVPDFYEQIAEKYDIPYSGDLIRKLLKQREYKSDTIHFNAKGYARLAQGIAELLKKAGAISTIYK